MEYDYFEKEKETVAEVWLPSKNETEAESVFRLISSLPGNISLEYFGRGSKRLMLVRGNLADVRRTGAMITAAYPSASLHFLDADPSEDMRNSESLVTVDYGFSGENYLSLKRIDKYREYDPVHTILSGLLELGADESLWIQIRLLDRRQPEWLDTVLKRVKAEKQKGFVTNASNEGLGNSIGAYTPVEQYRAVDQEKAFVTVLTSIVWFFVLLLYLLQMTKYMLFFLGAALFLTFIRAKMPSQMDDPWYRTDLDMVKMKAESQHEFNLVSVRLSASSCSIERSHEIQKRMRSVMNLYSLSGGNSLVPVSLHEGCYVPQSEETPVMEMCDWELASFWHIPWISGSVSPGLIPVRGVEMRCPDMDEVTGFYRIGDFTQPNGDTGGVFLNSKMMKHNMFLIGKPGTGKTTLMEHIVEMHPEAVSLLKIQYRMNDDIMRFSSNYFYNGQVESAPEVKYRSILDLDTPMTWIDTSQLDLPADSDISFKEQFVGESFGRINKAEAEVTLLALQHYFNQIGKQRLLDEHIDVGIISPYRAQVQYLRRLLMKREFFKPFRRLISVNTVDGFQGQERDIIVISMVRSNDDGQIGFLRDLRRMNVAITRARMKLIILGDKNTMTRHPFYQQLSQYIDNL